MGTDGGNRRWVALAAILVALGIAASALAAGSLARHSSEGSLRSFEQASNEIASNLELEIQRDQDLMESAAAFISVRPGATNAELAPRDCHAGL